MTGEGVLRGLFTEDTQHQLKKYEYKTFVPNEDYLVAWVPNGRCLEAPLFGQLLCKDRHWVEG